MQHLIFESSPAFIFLCALAGVGYAYLLYRTKHPWSKRINQVLFGLRAVMVALLAFLLIGPIVKLTTNSFEKPMVVFLVDNSTSLTGKIDSTRTINQIAEASKQLKDHGYEVALRDLSGHPVEKFTWRNKTTDLNGALKNVITEHEEKNLASIVLLSDGIYNSGSSPVFSPWRVPISTVGVGDTIEHPDLILKNIAYNKIAYQGNKFPVRVEVAVQHLSGEPVTVSLLANNKVVAKQTKGSENKSILDFDFLQDANEKGIQRLDVVIESVAGESNSKNNRAGFFVEVIEGRKKILVIAPAPHPDIKALKSVVEKNSNYEFILHIPGISKTDASLLQPGKAELVIFHQPFDREMKTAALYSQLSKGKSSLLLLIGTKTNLRTLPANGVPLTFTNFGQQDEATPVVNSNFHDFEFSENSNSVFARYPPITIPFGKFTYPANARILLNQRIGSVATDRPMLLVWEENDRKMAAFVGDGLWKWRLEEFSATEKAEVFDETFARLIQYLSTLDDKRKFRFFSTQSEFNEDGPVVFEGQVYNDLFEKIYGNKIDIALTDEKGKTTRYNYTLSPGGERYRVGGLSAGKYQYSATTLVNGKKENVSGQFLVAEQNSEPQNLVADFGLLRKLSAQSGGKFYSQKDWSKLISDFKTSEIKSVIHSEESFDPLIHVKWFFLLLLLLISAEWFIRKYMGGY
ncbi:MAG: hypothetical protein JSS79_00510 [Bacteroidetes bacterium]|nr:hypothetical protein [Bacteroidota bacterium]